MGEGLECKGGETQLGIHRGRTNEEGFFLDIKVKWWV
jgi:hypothetical protein